LFKLGYDFDWRFLILQLNYNRPSHVNGWIDGHMNDWVDG